MLVRDPMKWISTKEYLLIYHVVSASEADDLEKRLRLNHFTSSPAFIAVVLVAA